VNDAYNKANLQVGHIHMKRRPSKAVRHIVMVHVPLLSSFNQASNFYYVRGCACNPTSEIHHPILNYRCNSHGQILHMHWLIM